MLKRIYDLYNFHFDAEILANLGPFSEGVDLPNERAPQKAESLDLA